MGFNFSCLYSGTKQILVLFKKVDTIFFLSSACIRLFLHIWIGKASAHQVDLISLLKFKTRLLGLDDEQKQWKM